ncbi:MAG: hypothetical protein WC435_01180 [Candidatus Paceibacterota bacterium]
MIEQILTQLKTEVLEVMGNGFLLIAKGAANFFIILIDFIKSFF